MCVFLQTLEDNVDDILTKFNEILYCTFWEKVNKLVKKSRFCNFMDDPEFLWIIRLCHYPSFIDKKLFGKFQENR